MKVVRRPLCIRPDSSSCFSASEKSPSHFPNKRRIHMRDESLPQLHEQLPKVPSERTNEKVSLLSELVTVAVVVVLLRPLLSWPPL